MIQHLKTLIYWVFQYATCKTLNNTRCMDQQELFFFHFLTSFNIFLRQVVNVLSIFSDLKGWEDEIGSEERWIDIEVKSACTSVNTRIDKSIITNIRFFIDLKLNIEIWLNWNPYTSLYTIECLEAFFFNKRINL